MWDSTTAQPHDLRLEIRAKNNVLWHAIFDLYDSVAAFTRAHNLEQSAVGRLLNLTSPPYQRNGALTPLAEILCSVTGLGADELFPLPLYRQARTQGGRGQPIKFIAEVSSEQFVSLAAARRLALPPTQEDAAMNGELRDTLGAVLETLTPREERVLRSLYGLVEGEDPKHENEVAKDFAVTRERIRQIQAKAMRKMRHPSRSRKLSPFLKWRDRDVPEQAEAEWSEVPPTADLPPTVDLSLSPAAGEQWWCTRCDVRLQDLRSGTWAVEDVPAPSNAADVVRRHVKVPLVEIAEGDRIVILVWGTAVPVVEPEVTL